MGGLVLAATTFEGLYALRGQLNTYRLMREYVIVCHSSGLLFGEIAASIDATSIHHPQRSIVGEWGRPAKTRLKCTSHLRRLQAAQPVSVVAVSIYTGRRHQIRVHTRHIGMPTVSDVWYCP